MLLGEFLRAGSENSSELSSSSNLGLGVTGAGFPRWVLIGSLKVNGTHSWYFRGRTVSAMAEGPSSVVVFAVNHHATGA